MGSLFSKPKVPTPPPPPPPATVRDEIGGVEQVPVQNPDGTYTYITRRLPLTAEQQAQKNEYEAMRSNALAEIKRLTSGSYQDDPEVKAVLDDWEVQQRELLQDNQSSRLTREEEELARRGLSSSSIAQGVRRQRDLDDQDAQQQLARERRLMSDSVRGQKLDLQNSLFQLADREQDLDTARAYQAGVSSQGLAAAVNETNNASLRDYYARQVTAAQNRGPGLFSNVLSAAAMPLTGSVAGGLLTGGLLGSLFGKR